MAASLSEKIPPIRPYRISLIPQGFHGVHAAGAESWDIPGGGGNGRQVTFSRLLFWMWNEVFDAIGVAGNGEIKTPVAVHSCLPKIRGFVVFLSVKRRMQEVAFQETKLLIKRALNGRRRILQCLNGTVGQDDFHGAEGLRLPARRTRISLRRNLTASSAVSNGP